jgi:hypothetical protein
MRFTFVILLFCCLGADAQMIIKAHANYRPMAVAAQNLLLDDYSGAATAYSLRKLDKDYTGSAIRVRRSNDNTEQDIGFTSAGNLDTASLKTFVGANSGFVTTWYNQADSSGVFGIRNAIQTTAATQPRIVNAGNLIYKNNDLVIEASSSQHLSQSQTLAFINFTLFFLLSRSGTGNDAILISNSTNYTYLHYGTTVYVGDGTTSNITLNTTQTLISLWFNPNNGAQSRVYRNNVSTTGNFASNRNYSSIPANLFRSSTIFMSELILYRSDKFNDINGINTNINSYYGIY